MTHPCSEPRVAAGLQSGLPRRGWGDETVLFNPISGDTHLIDPVAAEILESLMDGETRRAGLLDRLSRRMDLPRDENLERYLTRLLSRFEEIGLIEFS